MKPFLSVLIVGLTLSVARCENLRSGDLVAICGDSITENKLYSRYMADYLLLCQPVPDLRTMQFGWSGEVAPGFQGRVAHDVLPFRPTVATIAYGMNDGGYAATTPERLVRYKEGLVGAINELRKGGVRFIVVGSPSPVDTATYNRDVGWQIYNETLRDFSAAAQQVAEENGAAFADVNATLNEVMNLAKQKYGDAYHVCGSDGVHPSENGNLVIAAMFLKALGCSGDIGTFTVDWKTANASASAGHRVLAYGKGELSISSSRYPFCFYGDPADPASTAAVPEFLPFNEDLNRLMLVVKNAPAPRLRITWGKQSREFSAAAMESGVNLAAEFRENPFTVPFFEADARINEQQKMDGYLVKEFLHWTPGWSNLLPGNESSFARLEASVVERARQEASAVRQSIKPVEHTIRIDPLP